MTKQVLVKALSETRWLVQIGSADLWPISSELEMRTERGSPFKVVFPVIAALAHTGLQTLRDSVML